MITLFLLLFVKPKKISFQKTAPRRMLNIYKKEDCDCRYCLYCRRRNAVPSGAAAWKIRFARAPPFSMKTAKKSMNSIRKEKTNMKAIITRNDQTAVLELPTSRMELAGSLAGSVRHPIDSGDAGMRLRQIAEWANINFVLHCHIL